jgi:hypothetical protein
MATEIYATQQTTGEIRTHYIDFTKDLPTGVTVSSAAGTTTTYPTGGTATISIGAISANIVPVTVTSPTVAGVYYVDVTATLSSADKTVARLIVPVSWASVRAGMTDLVQQLREMGDASVNDFKVGGVQYWSDRHLQDTLDKFRTDFVEEDLYAVQQTRNGTAYVLEYRSQYGNLETVASGTSVFKLDNAAGSNLSGTLWTADYRRGVVTFNNDTLGSSIILTGRSYDLNAAAADIWRVKAANAAKMYSFGADGQSFTRNQIMQNCIRMMQYYEGQAAPTNISLYRSDNIPTGTEISDE